MKNKLQTFVKQYGGYLCLGLLFCCLLALFQFLYLGNADDRVYSTAAQSNLSDFLYFIRYHYGYVNGRTWVHVLLMLFLRFGVYPWRIFMPVCYTAIVYLIARLVSSSAQTLQRTLAWTCAAVLCVHTAVYKETLFWETGSFNYILPALCVGLLLLSLREEKHLWCTPILGFLCGSSMEQFGAVTFVCLLLWLGYREFRQKNRSHRIWFLVSVLTTFAGLLTLVLSPSVRARTYAQTGSLFDKVSYLFFGFWFHSKEMCALLVLLVLAACLYLFVSSTDRMVKTAAILLAAAAVVSAAVSFLPFGALSTLCTYGFAAAFLCAVFWAAVAAFRAGHGVPLTALLLGGGAQVMMLATQRLSLRTTMPTVFCFIVFALALLECMDFSSAALRIAAIACVVLLAGYNVLGYVSFAAAQQADYSAGALTEKHIASSDSRKNVESVIAECEQVRLEQIELHQQAAK